MSTLDEIHTDWGWLLPQLGFALQSDWAEGQSWAADGAYLTLTLSPNITAPVHDRRRAGLNHLAFRADSRAQTDAIMASAPRHGWEPLYPDRYPHAGGPEHYAGWLQNGAGFKVEIVADPDADPLPAAR